MDFSIVIAHRDVNSFSCACGEDVLNTAASHPLGLWATIHSIEMDLQDSGYEYEYCIQTTGEEKVHPDTNTIINYVKRSGKLGYHGHTPEPLSPPTARQKAADASVGDFLFFFDNHILVKPGYFKRALESIHKYKMDMLHSSTNFFISQTPVYHYNLQLSKNFWADGSYTCPSNEPYRIAAGGHGGFVINAETFRQVGGYWDKFVGYAGEEIYFDLKMALLGKTNWMDPQLIHWHYAGNRGYKRHYTDDYYINMMCCANIIGGEKWLHTVYESFSKNYSKSAGYTMFDLLDIAQQRSQSHADWLERVRQRDLDDQLVLFKELNIPF